MGRWTEAYRVGKTEGVGGKEIRGSHSVTREYV